MIRVNLLPFRAARKSENVKRQVIVFFAAIALFIVGCAFYAVFLMGQVADLESELAQAEADLVKYKKQAAEVDAILAEIAMLEQREATIEGLRQSRFDAVKLLDHLTQLISPPSSGVLSARDQRVWLVALKSKTAEGKQDLDIEGVAVDAKDVAAFMGRLENFTEAPSGPSLAMAGDEAEPEIPYFSDVSLRRLAASDDSALLNFKQFNIHCQRIKPGAGDEDAAKKAPNKKK